MFTIARSITAAGFGLLLATCAAMPAGAITMPALSVPATAQSNIIEVRDHGHDHWHHHHHDRWGSGHRLHGSDSYYDGDSGSGLLFKSFVTGTLFNRQGSQSYYNGHARDCASRYRSYRASDNTYQPSHGPRQACR